MGNPGGGGAGGGGMTCANAVSDCEKHSNNIKAIFIFNNLIVFGQVNVKKKTCLKNKF